MNTSAIEITDLLPQKPPFIFVDRLLEFGMEVSLAEFEVTGDCIFLRDGVLSEAGLLENIAQSCAARIGYLYKYIYHKDVRIGIIGSVRNLVISALPPQGIVLLTRVEFMAEALDLSKVRAEVRTGDRMWASGEIVLSLTGIQAEFEK